MKLICQNIPKFCESIRVFGCRFRCLQAIAEIEEQKALTITDILDAYSILSKYTETMNSNCRCGTQEHLIINNAFNKLGNILKNGRQIGTMQNNIPTGWDGKTTTFQYMILHWKTLTEDGHYTLADKDGNEIFDPWNHKITKLCKINIQRKLLYKIGEKKNEN